jgi:hypothetical protein
MALQHIPFDTIDASHLQALIDARAAEARDIDYKEETYGGKDAERVEFLADVSSFANTAGGDLLIGITAKDGIPSAFKPFTGNADAELLRLDSMARTGLEPRIPNLRVKAIPLPTGGAVLLIRLPRSYNPPHRVIFAGRNRFWARSSAGKYEPNVDELRALFTLAPHLAERAREFRMVRTAMIAGGTAPVRLMGRNCLVLHVVPFSAFDLRTTLSLPEVAEHPNYFPPLYIGNPPDWTINFDGFLTLSNADETKPQQRAYAQVFRSGAVEAVTSTIARDGKIVGQQIEAIVVKYTRIYVAGLAACGVEPPYALMVSLLGVQGLPMTTGFRDAFWGERVVTLDREQLHFAEVVFDKAPNDNQDCATLVRPILDQIANAAGVASTPTFDPNGKYLLKI